MNGTTPPVSLLPGGTAADAPSDMTVNTTSSNATVEPLTLGVMGGGQLGRMFVHAAQAMGYFTAVLDPDANSPAGRVSHRHIQTDYTDPVGLQQLAMCSAAITTEFENVPAPALRELAQFKPVSPGADAVAIAQDRAAEKAHFVKCGVPCAPYAVIESAAQLDAALSANLLPGILKTSRMGYDGKGQVRVKDEEALRAAWLALKQVPCVLEKMLPLALECSVIVARGPRWADGQFSSSTQFASRRYLGSDRSLRRSLARSVATTSCGGGARYCARRELCGRVVRGVFCIARRQHGGQ
jgi:5-(carboxyamino)imidazole ribonucleotide synthase